MPRARISNPFLVYWYQRKAYAEQEFSSLVEAVLFAKEQKEPCAFHRGTDLLGTWSKEKGFIKEK
jgi:hypothetical protein